MYGKTVEVTKFWTLLKYKHAILYVQPRYLTYLFIVAGWVEESFTNFDKGINWRSYVVCDVGYPNVNNWLWTPFIERGEANRIYIEVDILVFQGYGSYNWTIGHLKLSSKFTQPTMESFKDCLKPPHFQGEVQPAQL